MIRRRLANLSRVDHGRLAILYLALFGGLQILFLWSYRARFGVVIPIAGAAVLAVLLLVMQRRAEAWRIKLFGLGALITITTFGPSVVSMIQRIQTGLTFECDCMGMDEVAIDRVMHGQGIYGVDWHGTAAEGYANVWGGVDLHYFIHFPLMVLSAVPVRLLTDLLHIGFDYRMVVILFSVIALGAIAWLPIPGSDRFIVAIGIFLNPALSLMGWTGHDDMCYLALLLLGLALLARCRWFPAALSFGTAMALKPFAVFFLPLLVAIIWLRHDQPRRTRLVQTVTTGIVFGLPTILTVGPFLLANFSGTYRDLFMYPTHLIHAGGLGLGGLLVFLNVVQPDARFSLGLIQLVVVIPMVGAATWAFARRPSLGRFLASYSMALYAFLVTGRYFADNYGAALVAVFLCVPALLATPIPGLPTRHRGMVSSGAGTGDLETAA